MINIKLDKISTEDLIMELARREEVQEIEVQQPMGYKLRLPFNRIIKGKGHVTILICK